MTAARADLPVRGLPAVLHRARTEPAYASFVALRIGYVVLPLWMGIDKYAKVLNTDWPGYLAPWTVDLLPFSAQTAMYVVGAVEILAGGPGRTQAPLRRLRRRGVAGGHYHQPAELPRLLRHRAS